MCLQQLDHGSRTVSLKNADAPTGNVCVHSRVSGVLSEGEGEAGDRRDGEQGW